MFMLAPTLLVSPVAALWTPAALSNDKAWYVSDNPANTLDGGDLSVIADKGGLGLHAASFSGAVATRANSLNGRTVWTSDNGAAVKKGWFRAPTVDLINDATGATLYVVKRAAAGDAGGSLIHIDKGDGYYTKLMIANIGAAGQGVFIGGRRLGSEGWQSVDDGTDYGTAWMLTGGRIDYTVRQAYVYVNGTNTAMSSTFQSAGNSEAVSGMYLSLCQYHEGEAGFTGDTAEAIVIRGALNTSDRQKLEGYLAWQWALASSLPSDHPYKSAAPLR